MKSHLKDPTINHGSIVTTLCGKRFFTEQMMRYRGAKKCKKCKRLLKKEWYVGA